MTTGVFLLGVGGQKCGTSWLHDMLARSDQVDMGFKKESHIFDARTLPECARICRFAGIDPIAADMDKQVNPSPKTSSIPESVAEELARHYAHIYHYLADRFGQDRIRSLFWRARFVL